MWHAAGVACPTCGFINPLDFYSAGDVGRACRLKSLSCPPARRRPRHCKPNRCRRLLRRCSRLSGNFYTAAVEALSFNVGTGGPALASPKQLVGERRIATVILADVRSSTDLLERLGTEAWVEIMNRVSKSWKRRYIALAGI